MSTDPRTGEHYHPGPQPATRSDGNALLHWQLCAYRRAKVPVAVVLIRDVHIRTRVDIIPYVDAEMPDYVAPPSYEAAVSDGDHRVGDHLLPGHHPRAQRHRWAYHHIGPYPDEALVEDRTGGEGQKTPGAECPEPLSPGVVWPKCTPQTGPLPSGMNGVGGNAPSQRSESTAKVHGMTLAPHSTSPARLPPPESPNGLACLNPTRVIRRTPSPPRTPPWTPIPTRSESATHIDPTAGGVIRSTPIAPLEAAAGGSSASSSWPSLSA